MSHYCARCNTMHAQGCPKLEVYFLSTADVCPHGGSSSLCEWCGYKATVDILRAQLAESQAQNAALVAALSLYADKSGWRGEVIDKWSGQVCVFDYDGGLQDEPYEVAERALSANPQAPILAVRKAQRVLKVSRALFCRVYPTQFVPGYVEDVESAIEALDKAFGKGGA